MQWERLSVANTSLEKAKDFFHHFEKNALADSG
jgi:hypothetical protein